MSTDGFIQTPPDGSGKRADATELTNDAGVTVYRLRLDVPGKVTVRGDLLELLLREFETTNMLLRQGLNISDDISD